MPNLGPRLMLCAPSSSAGKTLITLGVLSGFRKLGYKVAPFKVGPDFIDPKFHELVAGRPSFNLDAVLCNPESISSIAIHYKKDADLMVIEGVMGLYDGTYLLPTKNWGLKNKAKFAMYGSSAHISLLLRAPTILILDAKAKSKTLLAEARGLISAEKNLNIAGIIINKVSSLNHKKMLEKAFKDFRLPILGFVPLKKEFELPSRNLGLFEPSYLEKKKLLSAIESLERELDIKSLYKIAKVAPKLAAKDAERISERKYRLNIGLLSGSAFSFKYPSTLEVFKELGATVIEVDPLKDDSFEEKIQAIYICGGYPEGYLDQLRENKKLISQIKELYLKGVPIWAECGGLLFLLKEVDSKKLLGIINSKANESKALKIGYRKVTALRDSFLIKKNQSVFGHEHHYYDANPRGKHLLVEGAFSKGYDGFLGKNLFASFIHFELSSNLELAENFLASAAPT